MGIGSHIWRCHGEGREFKKCYENHRSWNKGLTKDTDIRVSNNGKSLSKSLKGKKGHSLSRESRERVSEGMKKAHKEGRAWNIGKSRWNNEQSWPEKFFTKVIENEFINKEYEKEFPIGIYSADFAWAKIKKIIEIDGGQHKRFVEYQERDKRKDQFLIKEGWEVLRIDWSDLYKDTKKYIQIAFNFIHS